MIGGKDGAGPGFLIDNKKEVQMDFVRKKKRDFTNKCMNECSDDLHIHKLQHISKYNVGLF